MIGICDAECAISKESWLGGTDFDLTIEKWCLPLDNHWNSGMMEKWNNGSQKRMIF